MSKNDQSRTFLNPFKNKNIGWRTGKDLFKGKTIRINQFGVQNFADYFSESEAETTVLSNSLNATLAATLSNKTSTSKTNEGNYTEPTLAENDQSSIQVDENNYNNISEKGNSEFSLHDLEPEQERKKLSFCDVSVDKESVLQEKTLPNSQVDEDLESNVSCTVKQKKTPVQNNSSKNCRKRKKSLRNDANTSSLQHSSSTNHTCILDKNQLEKEVENDIVACKTVIQNDTEAPVELVDKSKLHEEATKSIRGKHLSENSILTPEENEEKFDRKDNSIRNHLENSQKNTKTRNRQSREVTRVSNRKSRQKVNSNTSFSLGNGEPSLIENDSDQINSNNVESLHTAQNNTNIQNSVQKRIDYNGGAGLEETSVSSIEIKNSPTEFCDDSVDNNCNEEEVTTRSVQRHVKDNTESFGKEKSSPKPQVGFTTTEVTELQEKTNDVHVIRNSSTNKKRGKKSQEPQTRSVRTSPTETTHMFGKSQITLNVDGEATGSITKCDEPTTHISALLNTFVRTRKRLSYSVAELEKTQSLSRKSTKKGKGRPKKISTTPMHASIDEEIEVEKDESSVVLDKENEKKEKSTRKRKPSQSKDRTSLSSKQKSGKSLAESKKSPKQNHCVDEGNLDKESSMNTSLETKKEADNIAINYFETEMSSQNHESRPKLKRRTFVLDYSESEAGSEKEIQETSVRHSSDQPRQEISKTLEIVPSNENITTADESENMVEPRTRKRSIKEKSKESHIDIADESEGDAEGSTKRHKKAKAATKGTLSSKTVTGVEIHQKSSIASPDEKQANVVVESSGEVALSAKPSKKKRTVIAESTRASNRKNKQKGSVKGLKTLKTPSSERARTKARTGKNSTFLSPGFSQSTPNLPHDNRESEECNDCEISVLQGNKSKHTRKSSENSVKCKSKKTPLLKNNSGMESHRIQSKSTDLRKSILRKSQVSVQVPERPLSATPDGSSFTVPYTENLLQSGVSFRQRSFVSQTESPHENNKSKINDIEVDGNVLEVSFDADEPDEELGVILLNDNEDRPFPYSSTAKNTPVQGMELSLNLTPCLVKSDKQRKSKGRRVTICDKELDTIRHIPIEDEESLINESRKITDTTLSSTFNDSPVHIFETTTSKTPKPVEYQAPVESKIILPKSCPTPGLRRSQRVRVRPIERHKNERIIYKTTESGGTCIIGIAPSNEAKILKMEEEKRKKRKEKLKKTKAKKKRKDDGSPARNLSTHVELPSDLDLSVNGDIPVINPDTGTTVIIECFAPEYMNVFVGPTGETPNDKDPFIMSRPVDQPAFGMGCLIVRPKQEKPIQKVNKGTLIFKLEFGKVLMTIHETHLQMEAGDSCFIPRGNTYSVKNLRSEPARLAYTVIKEED